MAFSPNGLWAASASKDGSALLWWVAWACRITCAVLGTHWLALVHGLGCSATKGCIACAESPPPPHSILLPRLQGRHAQRPAGGRAAAAAPGQHPLPAGVLLPLLPAGAGGLPGCHGAAAGKQQQGLASTCGLLAPARPCWHPGSRHVTAATTPQPCRLPAPCAALRPTRCRCGCATPPPAAAWASTAWAASGQARRRRELSPPSPGSPAAAASWPQRTRQWRCLMLGPAAAGAAARCTASARRTPSCTTWRWRAATAW